MLKGKHNPRLPTNPTHPVERSSWFMEDIEETSPGLLSGLSYELYLQTDHWVRLRERKLKQSGYRCKVCKKKDTLQVHHKTYERRGREKLKDLEVLCDECHEKEWRGQRCASKRRRETWNSNSE